MEDKLRTIPLRTSRGSEMGKQNVHSYKRSILAAMVCHVPFSFFNTRLRRRPQDVTASDSSFNDL